MSPIIAYLTLFVVYAVTAWSIRLLNEPFSPMNPWLEYVWLVYARPVVVCSICILIADLFLRARSNLSRKQFWTWSFNAAAFYCLAYVPDMFASFNKAGEEHSLALSVGFYSLGILTYGLIRGISCEIVFRVLGSQKIKRPFRAMLLALTFFLAEYLFFHTWHPITYFPALPIPTPASRFATKSQTKKPKYLLLQTNLDGPERRKIAEQGFPALIQLGERLSGNIVQYLAQEEVKPKSTLVIFLPEAFVYLENINDLHLLAEPVAQSLFSNFSVEKVVWVQGAYVDSANIVLGTEYSKNTTDPINTLNWAPKISVLRVKQEHMPMFEIASKGISYSEPINNQTFKEELPPPNHIDLRELIIEHQILICYESLFPRNWLYQKPSIVFTNHHLFNEFRIMNWVYVSLIRQISFLHESKVKMVANASNSGVLLPYSPSLTDSQLENEDWLVIHID